jgi:hypothetical protein
MKPYNKIYDRSYDYMSPMLEKTFDIDSDVNLVYKLGKFDSIIEYTNHFIQGKYDSFPKNIKDYLINGEEITLSSFSTNVLKNEECKKANEVNSMQIKCGIYSDGSLYDSKNKLILISLNYDLFDVFNIYLKYGIGRVKILLGNSNFKLSMNEITSTKIKTSISHELSHWLDDTFHNKFLTKLIDLADTLDDSDILLLKQKNVNMTYFEIEAQIHGIKQLKKMKIDNWDKYTLDNVFSRYSSLQQIAKDIYSKFGKLILNIWVKNLTKRMARENLLGKNMKSGLDVEKLRESLFKI